MDHNDVKARFAAGQKLLLEETTTREKFESIRTLIKGINPSVDKALEHASRSLSDYEKLHKGEIIELAAEHLSENNEEEKKRKKALLLLIKNWKQLQSEVQRVQGEFEKAEQGQGKAETASNAAVAGSKILAGAKGPFGIITLVAVVIVGVFVVINNNKQQTSQPVGTASTSSEKQTIKVIEVDNKQIPVTEFKIGQGPECMTGKEEAPHYHAIGGATANALDGTSVVDPGGCGFGKVEEVRIIEVEKP